MGEELELTILITKAKNTQEAASPTAAAEIAVIPTFDANKCLSDNIRAKTGKAVIDILTPMKSKKEVNGTSSEENLLYKRTLAIILNANGKIIPVVLFMVLINNKKK